MPDNSIWEKEKKDEDGKKVSLNRSSNETGLYVLMRAYQCSTDQTGL